MNFTDFYQVLGVGRQADAAAIKAAYRKLARQYHPDLNPGDEKAESRFQDINSAYEVLKDAEERQKYDEIYDYIKAGGDPRSNPAQARTEQHYSPEDVEEILSDSDFFEQLFGEGRRRNRATPRRGQDIHAEVEVELDSLLKESSKTLTLQREETCSECAGRGQVAGTVCLRCRGLGRVVEASTLEVKLAKGLTEGSTLRLKGQGEAGSVGAPRGDLLIKIHIQPKPGWEVDKHNLRTDLPISVFDAILGSKVDFSSLRGTLGITIPPGSQNHTVMRLSGQGLPRPLSDKCGDLYLRLVVQIPTELTDQQKQQIEALRDELRMEVTKQ